MYSLWMILYLQALRQPPPSEYSAVLGHVTGLQRSRQRWRPVTWPSTALYKRDLVRHTFCSQLDLEEATTSPATDPGGAGRKWRAQLCEVGSFFIIPRFLIQYWMSNWLRILSLLNKELIPYSTFAIRHSTFKLTKYPIRSRSHTETLFLSNNILPPFTTDQQKTANVE